MTRYQKITDRQYMSALKTVADRLNYDLFGPETIAPSEDEGGRFDALYTHHQTLIQQVNTFAEVWDVIGTLNAFAQMQYEDEKLLRYAH